MTLFALGPQRLRIGAPFVRASPSSPCRHDGPPPERRAGRRDCAARARRRIASKPSRARDRMSFCWPRVLRGDQCCLLVSEIEFGIMGDRRLARHAVGQDGAEAGPRFHPHIPFAGGGKFAPRHFAEIIQRRQMRRHRQIAQAWCRGRRDCRSFPPPRPIAASATFNSSRPARITFMSGARRPGAPVKRWPAFS